MHLLAYTDPGTGAMILQILAASCLGLLFYAKRVTIGAKSLFKKLSRKK